MNSCEIEIAVARHFNYRTNLIVPNVYWGLRFDYELDLIIVYQSHYASEVEIKISISDLKAEKRKRPGAHYSNKIRRLYFAVPYNLKDKSMALIPEKAGLLSVNIVKGFWVVSLEKAPRINKSARKLEEREVNKLRELAAMRIWNLKEALLKEKRKRESQEKRGDR